MNTLNINSNEIPFLVRIVEEKDTYGNNNCLTHDKKEPLIEFYDARYKHTPYGQFISRYYKETILEVNSGLILDGGVPEWKIEKAQMDEVKSWLNKPFKKPKLK